MNWDYIAGFFDGEGNVMVRHRTLFFKARGKTHSFIAPRITWYNTKPEILGEMQRFIGCGKIQRNRKAIGKHSAQYSLSIYRKDDTLRVANILVERCILKKDGLLELIKEVSDYKLRS